jgi:hypothetical protein
MPYIVRGPCDSGWNPKERPSADSHIFQKPVIPVTSGDPTDPVAACRSAEAQWSIGTLVRVRRMDGRRLYGVVQGEAEHRDWPLTPGRWVWVLTEEGDEWVHESFVERLDR